jgi:hypothetical protein
MTGIRIEILIRNLSITKQEMLPLGRDVRLQMLKNALREASHWECFSTLRAVSMTG